MRQMNALFKCLNRQNTVVAEIKFAEIVQSTDAVHAEELIVLQRQLKMKNEKVIETIFLGGLKSIFKNSSTHTDFD
jgi:hypothetical protein